MAVLGVALFAAANSQAQVSAHHEEEPKSPGTDIEVASPMVVEVKLPPSFGAASPRPGSALQKDFTDTHRYVCDKARIERLQVSRTTDKQGRAVISFAPKVSTGWYRQHVKLKLEVIAGDQALFTQETRFVVGTENAASALGPSQFRAGDPHVHLHHVILNLTDRTAARDDRSQRGNLSHRSQRGDSS
jgi:hypothetical protein